MAQYGFARTIRAMKVGQVVEFPVRKYSTVCATVTRFNTEYKAEGRKYKARVVDLSVTVTRLA
jgi:hypothetical protein